MSVSNNKHIKLLTGDFVAGGCVDTTPPSLIKYKKNRSLSTTLEMSPTPTPNKQTQNKATTNEDSDLFESKQPNEATPTSQKDNKKHSVFIKPTKVRIKTEEAVGYLQEQFITIECNGHKICFPILDLQKKSEETGDDIVDIYIRLPWYMDAIHNNNDD